LSLLEGGLLYEAALLEAVDSLKLAGKFFFGAIAIILLGPVNKDDDTIVE
jgi:hypothetical protein